MGKPKFKLAHRKNAGSPAYLKRVQERTLKRLIRNAALKYNCSVSGLQDCVISLAPMNLKVNEQYQQLCLDDKLVILKRPVVVSLFDGISSGLVALEALGIIPRNYFSSEIDEFALKIQRFNFGTKIHQLGDVSKLDFETLKTITPDLLFGGSPCSDLSRVNPNRRGVHGDEGTGPLFFEFLRVLMYYKHAAFLQNREKEFFWFFENTSNLDADTCSSISRYLGCKPIKLCSSMFVPMRRQRYFWTNIPICEETVKTMFENKKTSEVGLVLQDFLCGSGRTATVKTLPTFTSNLSNLVKGGLFPIMDDHDGQCHPYYSEVEKIFGFPIHFTAGPNSPLHIRKKVLAKTWDVHIIKFILEHLLRFWKC